MKKICSKIDCALSGIEQDSSNFYLDPKSKIYRPECRRCRAKITKVYRENNKNKKDNYNSNYYMENKSIISEYKKIWYTDNKAVISENIKDYRINNKVKILKRQSARKKERMQTDLSYKLRENVSSSIRRALYLQDLTKMGLSIIDYLQYSIQELKDHLEKQFEPWMNWNNWGVYKANSWDDDDQSTWTWQIDHIIPQSLLLFQSMQDDNFNKCWNLNNLRPYSAKLNNLDGVKRTRHIQ